MPPKIVKVEMVGEIVFLTNNLLQKCSHSWPMRLPNRPVTELAQVWWVLLEWAGGLEPLSLHLCCHGSLQGVSLPGEGTSGLLESPVLVWGGHSRPG